MNLPLLEDKIGPPKKNVYELWLKIACNSNFLWKPLL